MLAFINFALFIFFIPGINFLFCIFLGRFLGQIGIKRLSSVLFFLLTLFSYFLFYVVIQHGLVIYLNFGQWIITPTLVVDWGFFFDSLTVSMLLIVTMISFLVHIYSFDYMANDPHFNRFISYLSLFTFFMLILISADNLFTLFVGWEGVGVCSYLLVNFWFTRIQANKAAIKALLMNRLGDCGVLFGIITLANIYETVDISTLSILMPLTFTYTVELFNFSVSVVDVVACAFFIGTVGKSAQLGLHTWLPSAMEGPTPVSALIHAATMVTAGIFLIIRLSFIFEVSAVLPLILITGGLTAIFAALLALVQHDLKKIVAYSTCSQLGYMVVACGASNYLGGFFHLINHAFFKALLFLSAGVIIHYFSGEQDMRKMGQVALVLPFTYSVMLIATFAITGFPFLSGFYSKDVILENLYLSHFYWSNFTFWIATSTAALTSYYSWRLIYVVFFSSFSGLRINYKLTNDVERNFSTFTPLLLLCVGSIFSGYFLSDIFVILNNKIFFETIQISQTHFSLISAEFLPFYIKLIPTLFSFSGLISFFIFNNYYGSFLLALKFKYNFMYNFLLQFGFFDLLYNKIGQFFLLWAYTDIFLLVEKGVLERIGPYSFNRIYQRFIYFLFYVFQDFFFFCFINVLCFYYLFSVCVKEGYYLICLYSLNYLTGIFLLFY